MGQWVALRLRKLPMVHWHYEDKLELQWKQKVIVVTQHGTEVALVLRTRPSDYNIKVPDEPFIKQIVRLFTDDDLKILRQLEIKEIEALAKAKVLVQQHKLEMKLLKAEYLFDQSRLLFYFKADNKVDFRELLKSLAATFRVRIELRQIGVRDETKLLGGIGCCGKEVCCAQFMTKFNQVSTKMAKDQNLSLNPEKLSGICGRLLCCLAHEYEYYLSFHGKYPKVGAEIVINNEKAKVMDVNYITQKALIGFEDRRKTFVPLYKIKGIKEPVTGRNLWWVQEEDEAAPSLDHLLEIYNIAELVKKVKASREAKLAKKLNLPESEIIRNADSNATNVENVSDVSLANEGNLNEDLIMDETTAEVITENEDELTNDIPQEIMHLDQQEQESTSIDSMVSENGTSFSLLEQNISSNSNTSSSINSNNDKDTQSNSG